MARKHLPVYWKQVDTKNNNKKTTKMVNGDKYDMPREKQLNLRNEESERGCPRTLSNMTYFSVACGQSTVTLKVIVRCSSTPDELIEIWSVSAISDWLAWRMAIRKADSCVHSALWFKTRLPSSPDISTLLHFIVTAPLVNKTHRKSEESKKKMKKERE